MTLIDSTNFSCLDYSHIMDDEYDQKPAYHLKIAIDTLVFINVPKDLIIFTTLMHPHASIHNAQLTFSSFDLICSFTRVNQLIHLFYIAINSLGLIQHKLQVIQFIYHLLQQANHKSNTRPKWVQNYPVFNLFIEYTMDVLKQPQQHYQFNFDYFRSD